VHRRSGLDRRPPEVTEAVRRPAEVLAGGTRRVDEARDAVAETVEHLCLLRLREPARGNRPVEMLLRGGDERVHQSVHRLALRLRDLREALAALELGVELSFGQAEVVGRSREIAEEAEVPEPALGPAEER